MISQIKHYCKVLLYVECSWTNIHVALEASLRETSYIDLIKKL